ncbi:MAG: hypothetical protein JWO36_527 [Myxococcales bacterium]|nr:hypothetical protein [Myxococcales bacterium]
MSTGRVAPTVKLSDDAKFPVSIPPGAYVAPPASIPPTNNNAGRTPIHIPTPAPGSLNYPPAARTPSIPPANAGIPHTGPGTVQQRSPSVPPRAQSQAPVAASRRSASMISSPSLSMPAVPRRNSTLIAVVVILDLGLAGAGAMLLAKGISKSAAVPANPPPASLTVEGPKSAAFVAPPGPTVTPINDTPAAVGSGSAAVEKRDDAASAEPAPDAQVDLKKDRKRRPKTAPANKADTKGPLDPYATSEVAPTKIPRAKDARPRSAAGALDPSPSVAPPGFPRAKDARPRSAAGALDPSPSVAAQVNSKAITASGVFLLCHNNAGPVHGSIQIAFQVLADGHVARVAAVENTTGSAQLASCLANTIASWTFPPHTGEAAEFVRPFKYD